MPLPSRKNSQLPSYLLHAEFQKIAASFPDKTAVFTDRKNWSYRELSGDARLIGNFLRLRGIKKGERAAVLLENCPQWPAIYFGIVSAGAVCVPIDIQSSPSETANLLVDSNSRFLFTSARVLPDFREALSVIKNIESTIVVDLDKAKGGFIPYQEALAQGHVSGIAGPGPEIALDDTASLIYTSGTTGKPKAVVLSHRNFSSNVESICSTGMLSLGDNVLSILPLHHSYPFTVTMLAPLTKGGSVTYAASLKSEEIFAATRKFGVTIFVGVPQIFDMVERAINNEINKIPFILRSALLGLREICWLVRKAANINCAKALFGKVHSRIGTNMRFFVSGGARLEKDTALGLFKYGFTVIEGYGLTETAPVVTFNPMRKQKIGSVGKAVPGVEARIAGADHNGIGEIAIKGPNVFSGYCNMPRETSQVLKYGWFYSGDQGYMDKEGFLYITGRIKDVIVLANGKNIYPDEIEAHYQDSRYIKEICVFSAREKGGEKQEMLYAAVVPDMETFRKEGRIHIENTLKWEIENRSKELASYKRIMGFSVANEPLPRTRLGKLKRFEIKDAFSGRQAKLEKLGPGRQEEEISGLESLEATARILETLKRECGMKARPSLSGHLELDLGIDSLKRIEIIAALEKQFKIKIPDTFLADVYTVSELVLKLEAFLAQAEPMAAPEQEKAVLWEKILSQDPRKNILDRIELAPSFKDLSLAFIWQKATLLLFKIFLFLKVEGRENLPQKEPYILCVNHTSYLDGFIVASAIRARDEKNLFFLGYSAYFEHPLVAWGIKIGRLIPIDPANQLVDALQASSYVLRNGKAICVFPEGERSSDGNMINFKKGVGILARELGVPLVPAKITGAFKAWPRTKALPAPHPVSIKFGNKLSPAELLETGKALGGKDDYEMIASAIRQAIADL